MTEVVLHPAAGEMMTVSDLSIKDALSIIALANWYDSICQEEKRQILKKCQKEKKTNFEEKWKQWYGQ